MSYLIRRVLAKPRLILDEMCRLYGKFVSYLRRVLCKTRLIFPRINGPINSSLDAVERILFTTAKHCLKIKNVEKRYTRLSSVNDI